MKKLEKLLVLFFVSVLIAGCSTYKARDDGMFKVGYEEALLDDGSYQLTYYGSTSDSHERVEKLWRRRANELCRGEAYEASSEKSRWQFDAYTILFPLVILRKAAAPTVEGTLKCNEAADE